MSDCEEEQCYQGCFPEDGEVIRYGDHVYFKHVETDRYINTDGGQYEGGSGQQHVYASESKDTAWVALPVSGDERLGYEIGWDDEVVFKPLGFEEHRLHSSPEVESPASGQQEVSCFAENDENDNWKVICVGDRDDDFWRAGKHFYLSHVMSGASLHSHEIEYCGEHEVTAFGEWDENSIFVV